jgi:H+/Cl- antiporter ClcA
MDNAAETQGYDGTIKETVAILIVISSVILITYGLYDIFMDAYNIYGDGLSTSDKPLLVDVLTKAACYWLLTAFNLFILVPWIQKQPL